MRRKEHNVDDPAVFDFIASRAEVGYLGILTTDGYPRVIPVNFAMYENNIYFHGAIAGEKFDLLQQSPKVTFSIDLPYSYIPSYWLTEENACDATMFYKSALVKGIGSVVSNPDEKINGLNLLMEKHQPEGRYQTMTATSELYKKIIKATVMFKVEPNDISIKVNFRRKQRIEVDLKLIDKLRERGTKVDLETAAEIQKIVDAK